MSNVRAGVVTRQCLEWLFTVVYSDILGVDR